MEEQEASGGDRQIHKDNGCQKKDKVEEQEQDKCKREKSLELGEISMRTGSLQSRKVCQCTKSLRVRFPDHKMLTDPKGSQDSL